MKAVEFVGQTTLFGPPKGWDQDRDGACGSLPVMVFEDAGQIYHRSCWKPSAEELAELNAGGHVVLSCIGIQPPVAVDVGKVETLP